MQNLNLHTYSPKIVNFCAKPILGGIAITLSTYYHKHSLIVWSVYLTVIVVLLVPFLYWQKRIWEQPQTPTQTLSEVQSPPKSSTTPNLELRAFLIPANDPIPSHPCGAVPESMKVAFVGSMVTKFSSELKSFSLIRIAGEDVLSVEYNADNAIVINATIRDESNNIVATIKKNVFRSYVSSGYQVTNPDPHTVLVLDANDHVILYVRYLNPRAIKVLGIFRQPPRPPVRVEEGRFFIGNGEFAMTVCGEAGGTDKDWWQLKAALVVE